MKKITLLLSLSLFIPAISFAAPAKQKPMVLCAAKDGTIKAKLKCTKKETKLNLNSLKGEKGDKGDKGERGPKGEKGDTGANGDGGASYSLIREYFDSCELRTFESPLGTVNEYDIPQNVIMTAMCEQGEVINNWSFSANADSSVPLQLPILSSLLYVNYTNVNAPQGIIASFSPQELLVPTPIQVSIEANCCKLKK